MFLKALGGLVGSWAQRQAWEGPQGSSSDRFSGTACDWELAAGTWPRCGLAFHPRRRGQDAPRTGGSCRAEGRAWHSASARPRPTKARIWLQSGPESLLSHPRDPRLQLQGQGNPSPAGVTPPGLGSHKPPARAGRRRSHAQAPDPRWRPGLAARRPQPPNYHPVP